MRLVDWTIRLQDLLQRSATRTFESGTFDCCAFAADDVLALTGVDVIEDLRGLWTSEGEATDLVNRLNGLQAEVTRRLGSPVNNPWLAKRGDIGMYESEGGPTLAVCVGEFFVGPSKIGLYRVNTERIDMFWPIGG